MLKNFVKTVSALIIVLLVSTTAFAESSTVNDYVGSGKPGANNAPRLSSTFYFPYSIAWDKDGGMIVVDTYNNLIRKVKDDMVSTIAGLSDKKDTTGLPLGGLVDDDAAKAMFNKPRYAVVDSKGNIFVSDTGNHAIRKISGGKVYTFAGSGKAGYADGTGIKAQLNSPCGIAIDKADNLYVADSLNHVIRKITPTGVVATFAGKQSTDGGFKDGAFSEALFTEPSGIAVDKSGALYVLDSGNQLVRKIDQGAVTTYAGTKGELIAGTAYAQGGFMDGAAAKFNFPKGIDIAEDGTLFIADTWNHAIRAIKPNKEVITIAGAGTPGKRDGTLLGAMFNSPTDVKYKSGNLYIADMWNNSIRMIPLQLGNLPSINDKSKLLEGIQFNPKSNAIQVWVDKKQTLFPDVQPYVANGKTFVPLRFICESWGAQVQWEAEKNQVVVTKGKVSKVFKLNGESIVLKGDRTMIHIRALAEGMGFYVQWVDEHSAVVIS
ncbi:MAG: stalk domain-containing protein, partial [Clostridia bacterium]|nr:stalk domain-containing protein [Clostridia bacterium]